MEKVNLVFEKISRKCKGKKLIKTAMSGKALMGIATVPLFMAPKPKTKVTSVENVSGKTIAMKKLVNLPRK